VRSFTVCTPHQMLCGVIQSRRIRWVGYVARMGQSRGVCRVLVREPEGTRTLGRPSHRWDDSSKINLQEIGWKF